MLWNISVLEYLLPGSLLSALMRVIAINDGSNRSISLKMDSCNSSENGVVAAFSCDPVFDQSQVEIERRFG